MFCQRRTFRLPSCFHSLVFRKAESGFSIVESLVAISIFGIVVGIIISFWSQLAGSNRILSRKIEIANEKKLIQTIMADQTICDCLINPLKNTAIANRLYIDPNSVSVPDLKLDAIWSSCDKTNTANLVLQKSGKLGFNIVDVLVGDIALTEIFATGEPSEYLGSLVIQLKIAKNALPSIKIPIRFLIDTKLGSSTSRPISKCVLPKPHIGLNVCPTNFDLVGSPGDVTSFCIEHADRSAANFFVALDTCQALKIDGFSSADICNVQQWQKACKDGLVSGIGPDQTVNYARGGDGLSKGSPVTVLKMSRSTCDFVDSNSSLETSAVYKCCL